MQQTRSRVRPGADLPVVPVRRIRHQARDGLLVAGCSLGLSVGAAGLLWLLGWWLA